MKMVVLLIQLTLQLMILLGLITLMIVNVIVDATIENVDCTGNNTGSINNITLYSDGIPILESDGIFSVEWGSYDPNNLYAGTYTVSITNTTTTPPCTFYAQLYS